MATTALLVEYLVSGVLSLFGLVILVYGYQGNWEFLNFSNIITEDMDKWIFAGYGVIISLSYGLGILVESVALNMLEWLHKGIKESRKKRFTEKYLKKTGLLISFNIDEEKSYTSAMRYYVLKRDASLFREIEGQHTRMRLTRVMFLLTLLMFLAISLRVFSIFQLYHAIIILLISIFILMVNGIFIMHIFSGISIKNPFTNKLLNKKWFEFTIVFELFFIIILIYIQYNNIPSSSYTIKTLLSVLFGVIGFFIVNFYAVIYRFDRFCSTIERTFVTLFYKELPQ